MLRVAICGTCSEKVEQNSKLTGLILAEQSEPCEISCFSSGIELVRHIANHENFQIIFLEAEMRGLNGIEIAKEIKEYDDSCLLIFYSDTGQLAAESYQVDALYYYLFPAVRKELEHALNKAVMIRNQNDCRILKIKGKGGLYYILHRNIEYIESTGHRVTIHFRNGGELVTYGKLDLFERYFETDKRFIRIHKSCIINIEFVYRYSKTEVEMKQSLILPVSRNYMVSAVEQFNDYYKDNVPELG